MQRAVAMVAEGKTQRQIAKALDVDQATVSRVTERLMQNAGNRKTHKEPPEIPALERRSAAIANRQQTGIVASVRAIRLNAVDRPAPGRSNDVAGELTEAINQALTIEAKLLGLHGALLERARTNPSAGHAAERIAVIIRAAKRSAGVRHNAESGRRLLAALCEDPGAKLT